MGEVVAATVDVVGAPSGKRPFHVHIDPSEDGENVAFAVLDRVRNEMLDRIGMSDLQSQLCAKNNVCLIEEGGRCAPYFD